MVVGDGSGATVLTEVNSAFNTCVTSNSGSGAPATTYGGMLWADTTNGLLKVRNAANSAWFTIGSLTYDSALFLQAGTGAVSRTLQNKERDFVNLLDFGADPTGVADSTTALTNAIAAAVAANQTLYFGPGTFKVISAALAINTSGVQWSGDGVENTIIKATGNFAQLLELQASSAEFFCNGITFDTTGTTTRCIKITRGQTPHFENCGFRGNLSGTLVYSTGDICQFSSCKWDCSGASTLGLEFDEFNQNCSVDSNSRFGGIGLGIKISRSGANARVEGLKICDTFFINTGTYNINIGNSFLTIIAGCVLDQCASLPLTISGGADKVIVDGNWIAPQSTGNCIQIASDSGSGHIISNNHIYGGNRGVVVQATSSLRIANVLVDGNVFDNMITDALELDSVNGCIVTNNFDRSSSPSSGSWVTLATNASGGDYIFANNKWSTNTIAAFHAASLYRFGNDTGLRGRNRGAAQAGAGVTSLVITHGLFTTPSVVTANIEGANLGAVWITARTTTTFTVNWVTSSNPLVHWQAEI
jgi:hypothetical protein